MRTGVVFPQIELGGDPGAAKAFAQAVEGLGYNHLLMYDHVLGAQHVDREPKLLGPYTERDPFHEPFIAFAYLAGITTKLELATGVIILPQRQTALVAKQVADLDLFSGGRVRLGVGTGWNWVEYDALEMPEHFKRRGQREENQIALLRKLWAGPVVTHDDADHHIERAGILPLPKRQIPIWLGGFTDMVWRRAARIGDGFIFSGRNTTNAPEIKERIDGWRADAGRDSDPFGCESILSFQKTPDEQASELARWRDAGGSHVSIVTMGCGLADVDAHIDAISRWRELV
jgi:probable F420-dependent oxidoreductase